MKQCFSSQSLTFIIPFVLLDLLRKTLNDLILSWPRNVYITIECNVLNCSDTTLLNQLDGNAESSLKISAFVRILEQLLTLEKPLK